MMRLRFLAVVALAAAPAVAQDDFATVKIGTEKVADGIYVPTGRGGNIGLFVGKDGAFLIDDQYAPDAPLAGGRASRRDLRRGPDVPLERGRGARLQPDVFVGIAYDSLK